MSDYYGNLALKARRSPAPVQRNRSQPTVRPQFQQLRPRRIRSMETPAPEQSASASARAIRRDIARQRLRSLMSVVCIVLLVTGIFTLVVYRQAKILELNFDNLKSESERVKIEQQNGQISEALAQKTNLDQIRQQAIEKLGLQDPASSQIVMVSIPDSDRIIFANPQTTGNENDAFLANAFSTIEGYFKSMNQQRQGD